MITILHRGGYGQKITILHREGGVYRDPQKWLRNLWMTPYSTTVLHPSLTCQRMNFNFIRFSNSKKGLLIYFQSELLHVWWVFLSILWWVANSVSFMHRLQLSAPSVNLKSQFWFETRRLCNKYICFITPYMYTYMYQLSVKWNRRRITSL